MAGTPVRGIDSLDRAFRFAGKRMRKELPVFLKGAARPVERDAELAAKAIGAGRSVSRRKDLLGPSQDWSQMRLVATRRGVYMAPQSRSTRIQSRKRPKFGPRLLNRAMIPALNANRAQVGKSVDDLVARIVRQFNRG